MHAALSTVQPKLKTAKSDLVKLDRSEAKPLDTPNSAPSIPRALGNQNFINLVQPKLKIGQPDDRYEQEADRVAEQIMRMPVADGRPEEQNTHNTSPVVQRLCTHCKDELKENPNKVIMRKDVFAPGASNDGQAGVNDSHITEPSLSDITTGGVPLETGVKHFFEQRFTSDFSDVRIHSGPGAVEQCERINAHAFTFRNHIWFGRNQKPARSSLLAHELAHVIQQRPVQQRIEKNSNNHAVNEIDAVNPQIRRVNYWVVGGRSHSMGGNAIQNTLDIGSENNIPEEVWIPNAGRRTANNAPGSRAAFGVQGRADYYRANKRNKPIGVFFNEDSETTQTCGTGLQGSPQNLRNGTRSRPRLENGTLTGARQAPTDIEIGELKPADPDQIAFGRKQLAAYREGVDFAVNQANCYWQNNRVGRRRYQQWGPVTTRPLTGLRIPSRYQYNASSPRSNFDLSIGQWYAYESVRVVFDPRRDRLAPIRGGLYAMEDGNGLYTHFARPANPRAVFESLAGSSDRSTQRQAWVSEATWVQNQIVRPLLSAPQAAWPQRRMKKAEKTVATDSKQGSSNIQTENQIKLLDSDNKIRRNRRRGDKRIVDDFTQARLVQWQNNFDRFSQRFRAGTLVQNPNKLQFLGMLYDTEEASTRAGIPQASSSRRLPPRSSLRYEFGADPRRPTARRQHGRLDELYDWLDVWSNSPMRRLGQLRKRFGRAFVTVSQKMNDLKARFRDRMRRQGRSARRSSRSWAAIAIKAFWNSAVAIGGVVLRQTFGLLTDSLASGIQQKIRQLIPFDDVRALRTQVEEGFPILTELQNQFEQFQTRIETTVTEMTAWFDGIMDPLRRGTEVAQTLGSFIKWALIAIQCGTPPGLGCLKLILQEAAREAIDWLMQTCLVRQRMAQVVQATGFFTGLPGTIGTHVANTVEGLLPNSINPIFDRNVLQQTPPEETPECDETEVSAISTDLLNLEADLGEEMFSLIMQAAELYGVPSDEEVTAEDIQRIRDAIQESGITPATLREFIESNPRPVRGEVVNITDFIEGVQNNIHARRLRRQTRRFSSDWYQRKMRELRESGNDWAIEPITREEVLQGAAFAKPMIYRINNRQGALGVANIAINVSSLDCTAHTVRITFVEITVQDRQGSAVNTELEGSPITMQLEGDESLGGLCNTQEAEQSE